MNRHADPLASPQRQRRRRRARPAGELDLFGAVPEQRSAAAMDDAAEARRLMDDLLALVDAGLVEPVADGGQLRYRERGDEEGARLRRPWHAG